MATAEAEVVKREALAIVEQSRALVIVDQETYDLAVDDRGRLKDLVQQIDERFAEPIQKAHEAHKAVIKLRNDLKAPVEAVLKDRNRELARWDEEREAERERLEEEALEKARLDAERERAKELKRLRKKGFDEQSIAAVAESPLKIKQVEVEDVYQKSDKLVSKTTWSCEVVDKVALIKYVAKNIKLLHHLLEVDQAAVNRLARDQKQLLSVPGLRAVSGKVIADKPRRG